MKTCGMVRLALVLLLSAPLFSLAAATSLELLSISPKRLVELRLSAASEIEQRLEISSNLTAWSLISVLTPTNGTALYKYDADSNLHALFFRSVQVAGPSNLDLQPQPNPRFSVTTLLTPEGGEVTLFMPDTREVTLIVPPGSLINPAIVTLTLVTNLGGLPFARGTFGALRLEPENFEILGAATLLIPYARGVDRRQVVSFAAANDGSDFHLVLDRARSNHVMIPITRFGIYGSSAATAQELTAAAAFRAGPLPGPQIGKQIRPMRSLACWGDDLRAEINAPSACFDCFEDLVLAALTKRCALRQAFDQMLTDVALEVDQERQRQGIAVGDDLDLSFELRMPAFCQFYTNQIACIP
jgi:hypothetical protein